MCLPLLFGGALSLSLVLEQVSESLFFQPDFLLSDCCLHPVLPGEQEICLFVGDDGLLESDRESLDILFHGSFVVETIFPILDKLLESAIVAVDISPLHFKLFELRSSAFLAHDVLEIGGEFLYHVVPDSGMINTLGSILADIVSCFVDLGSHPLYNLGPSDVG